MGGGEKVASAIQIPFRGGVFTRYILHVTCTHRSLLEPGIRASLDQMSQTELHYQRTTSRDAFPYLASLPASLDRIAESTRSRYVGVQNYLTRDNENDCHNNIMCSPYSIVRICERM
jgi:hypothetical protein